MRTCFLCKWTSDQGPPRSLHKFPKDKKLKEVWLDILGRDAHEHFRRLAPKLLGAAAGLSRLLPNLGGPTASCRRLYEGVVRSMALYGAPIWAHDLTAHNITALRAPQRAMAVRLIRGYRTVSFETASLLAGSPPWDLEAGLLASLYTWRQQALEQGERPAHRDIEARRSELRRVLVAEWKARLVHPSAGHATIVAVSPVVDEWLERRHGVLTFRLTQILTGHGCFGRYLWRIGREETPGCHHCGSSRDPVEDTALHTLAECPAWASQRRDLVAALNTVVLSLPAVVLSMVRSERSWNAVASFCEAVMLSKEAAEREREIHRPLPNRRDAHIGPRSELCCIHFEENCFRYGLVQGRKRLKHGSYPTLHLTRNPPRKPPSRFGSKKAVISKIKLPVDELNVKDDLSPSTSKIRDESVSKLTIEIVPLERGSCNGWSKTSGTCIAPRQDEITSSNKNVIVMKQRARKKCNSNCHLTAQLRRLKKKVPLVRAENILLTFGGEPICAGDTQGQQSSQVLDGKILIYRVYSYLLNEYEELKAHTDGDLSPLANVLKRTAGATGVSEEVVAAILEEKRREEVPEKRAKLDEESSSPLGAGSSSILATDYIKQDEDAGENDEDVYDIKCMKVEVDEETIGPRQQHLTETVKETSVAATAQLSTSNAGLPDLDSVPPKLKTEPPDDGYLNYSSDHPPTTTTTTERIKTEPAENDSPHMELSDVSVKTEPPEVPTCELKKE